MASDQSSSHPDHSHDDDIDPARDDTIDDALEDALAQNDYISISRLAFEQSLRFHRQEQYFPAVEYSDIALDAWRVYVDKASDHARAIARPTELRMVNAAATQNFNQGHFEATIELIQRARRLIALMPATDLTASTEWTTAAMERWRGDYPRALQHALRAWAINRHYHASALNSARVRLFVAQVALDCAASATARGSGQLVERYLDLARKHLDGVQPPQGSRHSPAVEGNFRLIYSAYSRLTGRNEDRAEMLESIVPLARALSNPILEGQIYTALADELSFQGHPEAARNRYQLAYETLLASPTPSLAVWPWRHLKQDWEYNLDRFAGAIR